MGKNHSLVKLVVELKNRMEGRGRLIPKISNKDKAKLEGIVEKLYEIVEAMPTRSPNGKDIKIRFNGLHEVLRKYLINPAIYNLIGSSFSELGIEPEGNIKQAIRYGIGLMQIESALDNVNNRRYHGKNMWWDALTADSFFGAVRSYIRRYW